MCYFNNIFCNIPIKIKINYIFLVQVQSNVSGAEAKNYSGGVGQNFIVLNLTAPGVSAIKFNTFVLHTFKLYFALLFSMVFFRIPQL